MKAIIISSFAEDRLITEKKIIVNQGGPAKFITQVYNKFKFPYCLICGDQGSVEIDMRNMVEQGKIISIGQITSQIPNNTEFVLISTLLDEFNLKASGKFNCVDIQGYVRDGSNFGKKKMFDSEELEKFDIIKATKEEIRYIPKQRVEKLKMILLTDGENGFEVIKCGKKQIFPIEKVETEDTIGAGDTFFAGFCVEYYKTRDIIKSAEFAKDITKTFLIKKKRRL